MKFKFLILSFAFAWIVSCSRSVEDHLNEAVQKHTNAVDSVTATSACTDAFNKSDKITSEIFCKALMERTDLDLSICEADIKNPQFKSLIQNCEADLLKKLVSIENQRNQGLSVHANIYSTASLNLGFELPTLMQVRDLNQVTQLPPDGLSDRQVILTFDDGPDAVISRSILRTLDEVKTKAHFFEVGLRIKKSPETTKLIAAQGHSIGNHSWDHADMQKLTFQDAFDQIKKTHQLLFSVLGSADPFFRYPYGNRTAQIDQLLAEKRMASFLWNIDSNDWRKINKDGSLRTNLQVVNDTMNQLDRRGRGIILMHDIHQRTAELLPELLKRLYVKGYTVVMLQPSDQNLKIRPPLLFDQPNPLP